MSGARARRGRLRKVAGGVRRSWKRLTPLKKALATVATAFVGAAVAFYANGLFDWLGGDDPGYRVSVERNPDSPRAVTEVPREPGHPQ